MRLKSRLIIHGFQFRFLILPWLMAVLQVTSVFRDDAGKQRRSHHHRDGSGSHARDASINSTTGKVSLIIINFVFQSSPYNDLRH